MAAQEFEERPLCDAQAQLETAYLEEYLGSLGYSIADLKKLPSADAKRLMTGASLYASLKLCEVEERSRFVDELHGTTPLRQH